MSPTTIVSDDHHHVVYIMSDAPYGLPLIRPHGAESRLHADQLAQHRRGGLLHGRAGYYCALVVDQLSDKRDRHRLEHRGHAQGGHNLFRQLDRSRTGGDTAVADEPDGLRAATGRAVVSLLQCELVVGSDLVELRKFAICCLNLEDSS